MNKAQGYQDLHDVCPGLVVDYENYRTCEREVISPALEKEGYTLGNWYDGERDSFGPLSRCIRATRGNEAIIVVYG